MLTMIVDFFRFSINIDIKTKKMLWKVITLKKRKTHEKLNKYYKTPKSSKQVLTIDHL